MNAKLITWGGILVPISVVLLVVTRDFQDTWIPIGVAGVCLLLGLYYLIKGLNRAEHDEVNDRKQRETLINRLDKLIQILEQRNKGQDSTPK